MPTSWRAVPNSDSTARSARWSRRVASLDLLRIEIRKLSGMAVGNDHQMARHVGVEIQDHEGVAAAMDHQVRLSRLAEDLFAEDASRWNLDPRM